MGAQDTRVPERVVGNKPTLYGFQTCPFCWKVRSLLNWKGVDYSSVEVDPMTKAEIRWADWKSVPVFVDADGTQVNDSNSILHYVDQKLGGAARFARNGEDEKQDLWMSFSDQTLAKSIVPVVYRNLRSSLAAMDYVTSLERFSRWQAFKAKWLGAVVMRLLGLSRARMFELGPEENLTAQLDLVSAALSPDFLGGSSPNGADFANYGILRSTQALRGFDLVARHPAAGPWYRRMQELSAT
ncbi:MAG: glutathione S-transferase N-terminal domain-containing protein [Candidatus Krumholzibacteriia bacterium]